MPRTRRQANPEDSKVKPPPAKKPLKKTQPSSEQTSKNIKSETPSSKGIEPSSPLSPARKLSHLKATKKAKNTQSSSGGTPSAKGCSSETVLKKSRYFSKDDSQKPKDTKSQSKTSADLDSGDSSDDFEEVQEMTPPVKKSATKRKQHNKKTTSTTTKKVKKSLKNEDVKSEDESSCTTLSSTQMEMEVLISNGKLVDINELRSGGVSVPVTTKSAMDSDEDSDWEEVEDIPHGASPEKKPVSHNPVEITIQGPDLMKKKKKKTFDMEDWFRRQVNKFKKDTQADMHKVHLLCLLSNGCHRNNLCNTEILQAVAMSVVPVEFTNKTRDSWTSQELKKLTTWFKDRYTITTGQDEADSACKDLEAALLCRIQTQKLASDVELVMLYVITVRSLGLEVRFVSSLQPVSPKARGLVAKGSNIKSLPDDIVVLDGAPAADTGSSKGKGKGKGKSSKLCRENTTNKNDQPSQTGTKKGNSSKLSGENTTKQTEKPPQTNERNSSEKGSKPKSSRKSTSNVNYKDEEDSDIEYITNKKCSKQKTTKIEGGTKEKSGKHGRSAKGKLSQEVQQISSEEEDFEVVCTQYRSPSETKKKKTSKKIVSSDSEASIEITKASVKARGNDYWAEVYVEKLHTWVCVDCVRNKVHKASEMEGNATKPMYYVLAFDNKTAVKDVTKKYAAAWMAHTRKLRIDPEWWDTTLASYRSMDAERDAMEDLEIQAHLMKKPMPTSVADFKSHPLYALKRHLLKFEAIYPDTSIPVGYVKGEPVYARDCVRTLHSRETWLKEGRLVRIGEEPYKMVKARPKWWKTEATPTEPTLPLFGFWQTEVYIPPPAYNGKVPRNEYGNVELFKPEMLPGGCVHLKLPGLNRIAKKLDIDCAAAMVGWDFHGGYNHAVHDGFVVCEEFKDTLLAAWDEDQEIQKEREAAKREKRVYGNWKLLICGLRAKEKIKIRFNLQEKKPGAPHSDAHSSESVAGEKATDAAMAWPLNRQAKQPKTKKKKKEQGTLFPFEVEQM